MKICDILRALNIGVLAMLHTACWESGSSGDGDVDASADTDTDSDSDSDIDTDADSDSDSDTDTDTDSDTGPDSDMDTDTDTYAYNDTENVEACDQDCPDLNWISIPGGEFDMGCPDGIAGDNCLPIHTVKVPSFEMTESEITVAQYAECVESGQCTEPEQCRKGYNWGVTGRENHPVNCVTWYQSYIYCAWADARLPSEAEWEYAACSGEKDTLFPWGDEEPSCDLAVIASISIDGCGTGNTWEVCSKIQGNSAQGLCDMAGNVEEWVQDRYYKNYIGAPTDGSAWDQDPDAKDVGRIHRGDSYKTPQDWVSMVHRSPKVASVSYDFFGFRCAR